MIGSVIGDTYRVMELIGSGGMAQVYKVLHIRARHLFAMKILKAEFAQDAEFLRRFEREAQSCLKLQHDNIVRAYGTGQFEGMPYIIMEYVEGETLKERVERLGATPSHKIVALGCQLLDALNEAHKNGIVHRDIKPQNIIITKRGKVKLTDFGIAREMNDATRTYAGNNVIGSAHYMSPEQARGEEVGTAGDLYSLGVTLYELATGRLPFVGDTAISIALQHLQTAPTPPRELNPEIPPALSDVLLRAMAKNPGERYPSCETMRRDLVRTLTDPTGDYVFTNKAAAKRRKHFSAYFWLMVGLCIPVLAVILFLFMYQSVCGEDPIIIPPTDTPLFVLPTDTPEPTIDLKYGALPNVCTLPLPEALQLLSEHGFTTIYSRPLVDENAEHPGTVLAQNPVYPAFIQLDSKIILTVSRAAFGKYHADVSFTVDIPANGSTVWIVYKTATEDGVAYYVLAYEAVMDMEQDASIPVTVRSNDPATRTLFLLIDGVEVAQQSASFNE